MIEQIITIICGLVLAFGGCWHSSSKRHSRTKARIRAEAKAAINPDSPSSESRSHRTEFSHAKRHGAGCFDHGGFK